MANLENYKSSPPQITGSTTINHAARIKLNINCSEYCLLDFLSKKDEKGLVADIDSVYIHTGFVPKETEILFKNLILKGFVYISDSKYELTSKWKDAFTDLEKEFDSLFWKLNGKVVWTGTRKKAFDYWVKLRKQYSFEFLVSQRDMYFKYLVLQKKYRGFDQQKVMCQVFLNPSNERFLEDYTDYVEQLNKKYAIPEPVKMKPLTKDDIINAYGKDNNQ